MEWKQMEWNGWSDKAMICRSLFGFSGCSCGATWRAGFRVAFHHLAHRRIGGAQWPGVAALAAHLTVSADRMNTGSQTGVVRSDHGGG